MRVASAVKRDDDSHPADYRVVTARSGMVDVKKVAALRSEYLRVRRQRVSRVIDHKNVVRQTKAASGQAGADSAVASTRLGN